jgi:pimeloyl-ACP methyl ester carboxylesterase
MNYFHITASDGCRLAFQTSQPLDHISANNNYDVLTLLIHGFSGSSLYFQRNYDQLSNHSWVIGVDLRGHGDSGHPKGGYHVARLAADLKELISFVRDATPDVKIVPVGCSIGAAVLWTYVELFSDDDFAGMVFVDQAPLQDRSTFDSWDESKAHRGCFDEKSMLGAQEAWIENPERAFKGLVADCLGYRYKPLPEDDTSEERTTSDELFFTSQSRRCNTVWLARLLADHTRYDHREVCEQIKVPVMVMAGARTGCFPLIGIKEIVRRVENGQKARGDEHQIRWSVFESGHWLFWEEPEKFNEEIKQFIATVNDTTRQDKSS